MLLNKAKWHGVSFVITSALPPRKYQGKRADID
jgi:hypothetical protein